MAGPDQSILAKASAKSEAVRVVDIDPKVADNKEVTPLNHLFRDRCPEYYV
jgi:hypothetical protein